MKTLVGWLVFSFVFVIVGSYTWMHLRHSMLAQRLQLPQSEQPGQENPPSYAEEQEARGIVTIHGPLLDYITRDGTAKAARIETLRYVPPKPGAASPVDKALPVGKTAGGTITILQQTFPVRAALQVPFEVPPHATSPQLHGHYHSSLKQAAQTGDGDADVEFLVLNEPQYAAFLNGRPAEATFFADAAHDQEVNAILPPTLDRPAQYHLIFRNHSGNRGKKVVQADFRVDF